MTEHQENLVCGYLMEHDKGDLVLSLMHALKLLGKEDRLLRDIQTGRAPVSPNNVETSTAALLSACIQYQLRNNFMTPTMIGTKTATIGGVTLSKTTQLPPPAIISTITLSGDQLPAYEKQLAALDFDSIPPRDIVQLGHEAKQGLNQTLDGFMARLDKNTAAPVFALFQRLQKGVKDADLDSVLRDAENAKPSFFSRAVGALSRKNAGQLTQEALDRVRNTLAGKTTTLKGELVKLEKELNVEIAKLIDELRNVEALKQSYGNHFNDFAVAAAVTEAFCAKAKDHVEAARLALPADPSAQDRAHFEELQTKLGMLQSRALALEGAYTRLPSDAEVIRQIEVAGVSTLGETLTTASSRFASIKMTLLSANAALAVKSLQNLNAASARLDEQLLVARGKLVKDAAVSAARAPGDNRLAQATQVQRIVAETAELYQAVDAARKENEAKFAAAKQSFGQARNTLANMGAKSAVLDLK